MRVIGDKVLVEVLPREDVVNPHGIHLPESKSTPVLYGMVLAHGAEVGGVFAVEESGSDQIEGRVPVSVFDDVPFGQVVGKPWLSTF